MRQVVLDTETTGLSADQGDRILEIGCVEIVDRRLTGNDKHFYINPERDSHEDALKVHGLTTEFLQDKPLFKEIAQELIEYLQGAELIIHNAPFDLGFLNMELKRLNKATISDLEISVIDSLTIARRLYPGKRNSLDALCDRLDVDNSDRVLHGALLDAQLLAEVYINMTRGQHALIIEENAATQSTYADTESNQANLSALVLPVITASSIELAAHDQVLKKIAIESGGKLVWPLATV